MRDLLIAAMSACLHVPLGANADPVIVQISHLVRCWLKTRLKAPVVQCLREVLQETEYHVGASLVRIA